MGQRFQSVFIIPEVFLNEDNPNNRSEKALVFHSQWLYGRGALNVNLRIMERIKQAINSRADCGRYGENKKDFINHFLQNSVLNAVEFARLQDLHNETRFSLNGEFCWSEEESKPEKERVTFSELLADQDNNNGFFICRITKNLKLEYAFISGLEDTTEHQQVTPKEYLNLFYKDEDLKEQGLFEDMQKVLNRFSKFAELEEGVLKSVISYLNNKKPDWAKPDGLKLILSR
jgi:hypothetical protein